jgi:hypothetical protein
MQQSRFLSLPTIAHLDVPTLSTFLMIRSALVVAMEKV